MERAQLLDESCQLVSNELRGPNLYLARVHSTRIASSIQPGQFVHAQLPGMEGHILRRPFSVYRADTDAEQLDILYQVVGFGTEHMATLQPGCQLKLIGPIGASWAPPASDKPALLVGGGVGAAPLMMLAQQLSVSGQGARVVLGAQTQAALVTYDDYCALEAIEVVPATDDGSFGHAGFCTQPAQEAIESGNFDYVACCGPEPLMRIVSGLALDAGLSCQVSLERRMACGVGACLSCVVQTDEGRKRACVDGPIFDARKVVW